MFQHNHGPTPTITRTEWKPDGFAWLPVKNELTGKWFWLKPKYLRYAGLLGSGLAWQEYTTPADAAWSKLSE